MNKKVLVLVVGLLALAMLATPVMAIGPENAENNPNAAFPSYGVGLNSPSGMHHEWVNAIPVPKHLMWVDARDFKINNAYEVTSISEVSEMENRWLYFSMEIWAAWLSEKLGVPYPIMLGYASKHAPEGVYYREVLVGK